MSLFGDRYAVVGKLPIPLRRALDERASTLAVPTIVEFCRDSPDAFGFALTLDGGTTWTRARSVGGDVPLVVDTRDSSRVAAAPSAIFAQHPSSPELPALRMAVQGQGDWQGKTAWSYVRSVVSGTVEIDRGGKVETFDLWPRNVEMTEWDEASAARHLRELLDAAVARRIAGARRIAVQLSSGLDSNAVLASLVAQFPASDIVAITAAPNLDLPIPRIPHRFADESGLAAVAARHHGVRHRVVRDISRIVDTLPGRSRLFGGPVPNPINQGWSELVLAAAKEEGCDLILGAVHGNATLSFGGLPILSEWLRRGQIGRWARQALRARHVPDTRWRGILANSVAGLTDKRSLVERRIDMMRRYDQGANNHAFEALGDIRLADPTGDRDIVAFAFSLPPEAFLNDGVAKPLFKRAMRGRIPDAILDEPLRGFQGADYFGRINAGEAMAVLEVIRESPLAQSVIDCHALEKTIAAWPAFAVNRHASLFRYVRRVTDALAIGMFLYEAAAQAANSASTIARASAAN